MMHGMMVGMGLWAVLLIVTLLAILVLAVLGSVWLFRILRQGGPDRDDTSRDEAAQELLRRRYAAGEIDDEEYERRLHGLTWR
ncbi:MAG: SHOCT domain-containing protein [Pseudonocardiaceae bacterium]